MTDSERPFSILFVCTGNICRSPTAAQLFEPRLAGPSVLLSSAGTQANAGDRMPEHAIQVSLRLGGNPGPHRSRPLTAELVAGADLVLGLAREHRAEVVRTVPRASRYAFTLLEFDRLLENLMSDSGARPFDPVTPLPQQLRETVARVAGRRGHAPLPEFSQDDDVADPMGFPLPVHEAVGEEILASVGRITAALVAHLQRPAGESDRPVLR